MKRISIVVPIYNEEETIEIYYKEIQKYLNKKYEFDIIFVNDGSTDQSQSIVNKIIQLLIS